MRRATAAALAAGCLLVAVSAAAPAGAASDDHHVRRVLLFSLPHVSWEDIQGNDVPNLRRLLDRSGVAALTTRIEERNTRLGDGYVTLGAGTRAVGDSLADGDNLGVDERFGSNRAGDVFTQRTGHKPGRGIVSLDQPRIVTANDSRLYDAEIGALATALADAGVDRAVIANGDGEQPDTSDLPATVRRRQAALALTDSVGRLPGGQVDDRLLEDAPGAPFGVRLAQDRVASAFKDVWRPDSVVLVEASDMVREDAYRPFAQEDQRAVLFRRSLRRSDALLGRLLEQVDLTRDAVIVFGPAHPAKTIGLTVLGVHAPGIDPGLLRSATTRRSGFVQLVDVAPTVLGLMGIERPGSMEGRAAENGKDGGSPADRIDLFVREDAAGRFRDRLVGPIQLTFVLLCAALVIAAPLVLRPDRTARARLILGWAALSVLGLVPAVYLARVAPLHELGIVPYWIYIIVLAGILGTLYRRIGRDDPVDSLLVALLTIVVLLVVDVIIGTPLAFNSTLGYSPTAAGRFAGFANPAYAATGASAVLAAPLLARRVGGRRGVWVALALLLAVVIVDGAPFWGSDVGGILSLVPACGVAAALLLGWRISARTFLWCAASALVAVAAFTLLDLSRAPGERTHLGRLVERVQDRGFGDFVTVVQRKLAANLGTLTHSIWGVMLPVTLLLVFWLVRRAPGRLHALRDLVPDARTALVAFGVLAVLGYAFNDSGIAIPGVMLVVLVTSVVWLAANVETKSAATKTGAARKRAAPARAS